MKAELREALGKAAYEAEVRWVQATLPHPNALATWEELDAHEQELRMSQAEAVMLELTNHFCHGSGSQYPVLRR